jgi:hypothetical protein
MAWTDITNTFIAVGKAVRARDIRALRDNIAALAAGEAGAPRIQRAAIAPEAVGVAELAESIRPSATLTGQLYSGVFNAVGEVATFTRSKSTSDGSEVPAVVRGSILATENGYAWSFKDGPAIPAGQQWRAHDAATGVSSGSPGSQTVLAVRVA